MSTMGILPARQAIRTRLLILSLGLTLASLVTIAYLGIDSILSAGRNARQVSSATLRAQAEEYLVGLTVSTAKQNDLVFEQVRRDAKNMGQFATSLFEHPEFFASQHYWRAADHMFVGPDGQYINGEEDTSTVFVPNSVEIDDELVAELELTAYMDLQFVPIYENTPNVVAIYIITKREISRLYPNIDLGSILPPDFSATQDIFFTSGAPENNPARRVVWTPVYDDPAGQGLLVTTVAPIYTNQGDFLGIIGIDVSLAQLGTGLEELGPVAGGYSFLINDQQRAIALPEKGYRDILGRSPEAGEFGPDLTVARPEFRAVLAEMRNRSTGFQSVQVDGQELFIAYAPLQDTGWSLATAVETENMLQVVANLQEEMTASTQALILTRILPASGLLLVLAVVVGLLLTNRLVNPIQRLVTAAQRIGVGEWDTPLPQAGNDEIGTLSRALGTMATQIRELVEGLEQRVAERTRDLQAATEVAQATTAVLDPETLLHQVVDLVRERFDFYYVGLFLLDEERRFAVLRAGTGQAGQVMVARGQKLEVGSESVVGQCTARNQARIALDVGKEPYHFDNPLLPQTRSELALPLRSRGRVMGAMTVQSSKPVAFDETNVAVMQTMADQVAVAIDNAQLFAETQTTLAELETIQQHYLGQAWTTYTRARADSGYELTDAGLASLADELLPEARRALAEGRALILDTPLGEKRPDTTTLVAPILLRGQPLGVLGFQQPEGARVWSSEEIALVETVAEQFALAADNLRLLEETQRSAARDRLVSEMTSQMRETLDVDEVLRIAVREIGEMLGLHDVTIELEVGTDRTD